MKCYVYATITRNIDGIETTIDYYFSVNAVSTSHALKKTYNYIFNKYMSVARDSDFIVTRSTVTNPDNYPLVSINNNYEMKGNPIVAKLPIQFVRQ